MEGEDSGKGLGGKEDPEVAMATGRGGETMTDVTRIQSVERTTTGGATAEGSQVVAAGDEMTAIETDEEATATATGAYTLFLNAPSSGLG